MSARDASLGVSWPHRRGAALTLTLLCLAACAPLEVVIATQPLDEDGGAVVQPRPCSSAADCDVDQFCEKVNCGDGLGTCAQTPSGTCPSTEEPVCGCDRVTYWNDCFRRQNAVAAAVRGECGMPSTPPPLRCDAASPCPALGSACARILPPQAMCPQSPTPGSCWVLPTVCPDTPIPQREHLLCGAPGACMGHCDALRSQIPHHRTFMCR